MPDALDNQDFFLYTGGRWLGNEAEQLAARSLTFSIDALKRGASAAAGASHVTSMVNLPEGSHNKAFLLRLDTGDEVVARLPLPIAGPSHYTTASEVATMDFVRNVLHIPVPRVLAWCSHKDTSAVGAEYIIMERASGIEIGKIWPDLDQLEKFRFIEELVNIEYTLSTKAFPKYGSLFYLGDPESGPIAPIANEGTPATSFEARFGIGPCMQRTFWRDELVSRDIDRGPWSTVPDYLAAGAYREIEWLTHCAPKSPRPSAFKHVASPDTHIHLLHQYLNIVPQLVLPSEELNKPALWHTDMHGGNIFIDVVSLKAGRPCITSIIDWQSISIVPLYLQARVPSIIRYSGRIAPAMIAVGRPANYASLSPTEQADVDEANLHKYYEAFTDMKNEPLSRALKLRRSPLGSLYIHSAGSLANIWDNKLVPFRDILMRVQASWSFFALAGEPCPLQFPEEEREEHAGESLLWQKSVDRLSDLCSAIGVTEEGWVHTDLYEDAVENNKVMLDRYLAAAKDDEARAIMRELWPFRVGGE